MLYREIYIYICIYIYIYIYIVQCHTTDDISFIKNIKLLKDIIKMEYVL